MSRVVYSNKTTLFPREDKTFLEVGRDELLALVEKHPEYKTLHATLIVRENSDKTGELEICFTDLDAIDWMKVMRIILIASPWVLVAYALSRLRIFPK